MSKSNDFQYVSQEKKNNTIFTLHCTKKNEEMQKTLKVGKGLLLCTQKGGKTDIETEYEKHIQCCRFQNFKFFEKTQQRK